MNWLNKLERKFGRYAVPNLIVYLIGAYSVGFVLNMVAPNILGFLNFQPYYILHGQIWRLITWILMPTDSNIIFLLIMMMFYYQLGTALERAWGTFRFNAYIIGGILLTEVGSLLAYGLIYLFMGGNFAYTASTMMGQMISTSYINMSIFLAFATLYPAAVCRRAQICFPPRKVISSLSAKTRPIKIHGGPNTCTSTLRSVLTTMKWSLSEYLRKRCGASSYK